MKRYIHKPCGWQYSFEGDAYCTGCGLMLKSIDLFELAPTFYETYLAEHSNRWNRLLHLAGLLWSVWHVVSCFAFGHYWEIILAPVIAYGTSWLGHFVQGNWPLSFKCPWQSFKAYWRMQWEMMNRV